MTSFKEGKRDHQKMISKIKFIELQSFMNSQNLIKYFIVGMQNISFRIVLLQDLAYNFSSNLVCLSFIHHSFNHRLIFLFRILP